MPALPLVPVPPASVRRQIPDIEWTACLQSWILSIEARLCCSNNEFLKLTSESASTHAFLISYLREAPHFPPASTFEKQLKRLCFLLTRRILLEWPSSSLGEFLNWSFISSFVEFYGTRRAVRSLLSDIWSQHRAQLSLCLADGKILSIDQLSPKAQTIECPWTNLRLLTLISCLIPDAGQILMTGSDYIDTLCEAYEKPNLNSDIKNGLVANLYVGLCSLIVAQPPQVSLLLDQLYGLKTAATPETRTKTREPTLLSALICSTDLLYRLEAVLTASGQTRGRSLLASLKTYQSECCHLHRSAPFATRAQKGKKPTRKNTDVSKAHLISEIKELLPDLDDAYVLRLFHHYSDNVETVVAHLLDNSIPPELQDGAGSLEESATVSELAPTQLNTISGAVPVSKEPERRNIFDNDEFDNLAVPSSQIRIEHAKKKITADDLLRDRSEHAQRKAAILSALAAFNSDDDERDDTYDIADVGGSIDAVAAGVDADTKATTSGAQSAAQSDLELFRHYKKNPATFDRSANTRRSTARAELRKATGMTDEAIEGWAVMLNRDSRRSAKLEQTLLLESGVNRTVNTTEGDDGMDDDSQNSTGPNARGGNRGGRGRGRGGKQQGSDKQAKQGGNNPNNRGGPSGRSRGGRNKGAHDRRNQHAKKMARAGVMPPE